MVRGGRGAGETRGFPCNDMPSITASRRGKLRDQGSEWLSGSEEGLGLPPKVGSRMVHFPVVRGPPCRWSTPACAQSSSPPQQALPRRGSRAPRPAPSSLTHCPHTQAPAPPSPSAICVEVGRALSTSG